MSTEAKAVRDYRAMRCSLLVVLLLAACEKGGKPPPPQGEVGLSQESGPGRRAGSSPAVAEAERMFFTVCGSCHGLDGKGRGPAAEALDPKPRDYTDTKWQASVTDDVLRKTIVLGGAAMGKSQMMPPNPKLKDQPEIVNELVKIVRSFGTPNPRKPPMQ